MVPHDTRQVGEPAIWIPTPSNEVRAQQMATMQAAAATWSCWGMPGSVGRFWTVIHKGSEKVPARALSGVFIGFLSSSPVQGFVVKGLWLKAGGFSVQGFLHPIARYDGLRKPYSKAAKLNGTPKL